MLTSLSILSLDQGPKWREPEEVKAPEVYPERLRDPLRAVLAVLAALFSLDRRPAASR